MSERSSATLMSRQDTYSTGVLEKDWAELWNPLRTTTTGTLISGTIGRNVVVRDDQTSLIYYIGEPPEESKIKIFTIGGTQPSEHSAGNLLGIFTGPSQDDYLKDKLKAMVSDMPTSALEEALEALSSIMNYHKSLQEPIPEIRKIGTTFIGQIGEPRQGAGFEIIDE